MKLIKTLLKGIVAATLIGLVIPASGQVKEAEELVSNTTDEMLVLIDQAKSYVDEEPERFYAEVESLLAPVIDFPRFARSVMAVHYKSATPAQRERFAEGFKWSLVRTYAVALTEFTDGDVRIIPSDKPPRRPDRASVKQEIRSGGEIYPVVYSMAQSEEGSWRLRNIIINGINMGLTYRNQFDSAVSDPKYGGDLDRAIDGWIDSLGAVNASGENEVEPGLAEAATEPAAVTGDASEEAEVTEVVQ